MGSKDNFIGEYEAAQRIRNQLQSDLGERDRSREGGESTARVDARLRDGIQKLAVSLDAMIRLIGDYESDPMRFKLTPKEIDTRRKQVTDLESDINLIDEKIRSQPKADLKGTTGVNFIRVDGAGETEDSRNMSNRDLQQSQQQMWKQQAEIEEALIGTSVNLVATAQNIGEELDVHNKLLDGVEANVDHQNVKITKTEGRMKELIAKSSDCCLIICIVVLIAVLVVIVIML
jgi:hypothetical protein